MYCFLRSLAAATLILTSSSCSTVSTSSGDSGNSGDTVGSVITAGGAESSENYRLGQGDRISIQVFDEPDLTINTQVGAKGSINYSYLGDMQVENKTAEELEKDIVRLLEDGYLVNPSVNVSIVEYRPFFINGEVRRPGSYPYQPGLTLDKAIALAGGLTDRASKRKMFLISAQNPNGKQTKVTLQNKIGPGDIISIQEGFF